MSDLGFAFYGYKRWTLSVMALSGALAPLLQQIPEVYFFGVGDMGISYNLLALVIRMASGAVYAIVLVKPIALALVRRACCGALRSPEERCAPLRPSGMSKRRPQAVTEFGAVTDIRVAHGPHRGGGCDEHPRVAAESACA